MGVDRGGNSLVQFAGSAFCGLTPRLDTGYITGLCVHVQSLCVPDNSTGWDGWRQIEEKRDSLELGPVPSRLCVTTHTSGQQEDKCEIVETPRQTLRCTHSPSGVKFQ